MGRDATPVRVIGHHVLTPRQATFPVSPTATSRTPLFHYGRKGLGELPHLPSVAWVAPRYIGFGLIEVGHERITRPHRVEPLLWLDGLREKTDVFGWELLGVEFANERGWVERSSTKPVVDNVMPDLQYEHPTHEYLVEGTLTEPVEVVEVADLLAPAPGCELLRQGFLKRRCREGGKRELIARVHRWECPGDRGSSQRRECREAPIDRAPGA